MAIRCFPQIASEVRKWNENGYSGCGLLEVPLLMAVILAKVLDQKLLLKRSRLSHTVVSRCLVFASKAFHHSPRTLQPVSSSGAFPCDMSWPCGPPLAKIMGSSVMWPDDLEHLYYSYLMLLDVYLHTAHWTEKRSDWQDMLGEEKVELWVNFLNECSFQYCEAATRTSEKKVQCWHTVPWSPCLSLGSMDATTILTAFGLNT